MLSRCFIKYLAGEWSKRAGRFLTNRNMGAMRVNSNDPFRCYQKCYFWILTRTEARSE